MLGLCTLARGAEPKGAFVRLEAVPGVKVSAAAEQYPGGSYKPENLVDGDARSEYSSNGLGLGTFVEFDLGKELAIAAFKHVDRNDPATVAASELSFLDAAGKVLHKFPVEHVNRSAGVTFATIDAPVAARRIRWQVTRLGSTHGTVGGAEIAFYVAAETHDSPRAIDIQTATPAIVRRQTSGAVRPLKLVIDYPYALPIDAGIRVDGQEPRPLKLSFGRQTITFDIPANDAAQSLKVAIDYLGKPAIEKQLKVEPARKTTIYVLPHSHTDIGYTEIQTEIENKQVNNLLMGMEYARKTADYPAGARFVWNIEVLWAADLYCRRLDATQRAAFVDAVKNDQVALNGMYLNELTGLCRPEELMRLFRFATQLGRLTGKPVDSAMISDVPGYTWGTVTAMSQAGIRYFSVAPNYFDRIGDILVQWENKPFYWVGPCTKDKVLVWIPYKGYAMSHIYHELTPDFTEKYMAELERAAYPYDIACMRWAGHGDNAEPDPKICEFIKEWSARYEWPKYIISSTSEAFSAFEKRYGDKLPQVRGDWTPYWEDGAGSSALETGLNRASSDRLAQAEAVWAMQQTAAYPAGDFETAWRNVLLYSEHTWGAWCSISEPARRETREQWTIKQSYAVTAGLQSRNLLSRALGQAQQAADTSSIDVFNANSWPRTDLVTVPKYLARDLRRVLDSAGRALPSQRLRNGELIFIARDVPPFAARRYTLVAGEPAVDTKVVAGGNVLDNGLLTVKLDEKTGGIADLHVAGSTANLVNASAGRSLDDYLYLVGDDVAGIRGSGPARIRVGESGPLVASLIAESDAPGCFNLRREMRLAAGADHVEISNLVDKRRMESSSYHAKEGKESVNFAFEFNVPDGQVRIETPLGVLRPDVEQIPSACKNWFTVSRWADVSNADLGVTWVTFDAPLVQVGGITANLLNSQTNPAIWRKTVGATQSLYSWAMNNHWGTNYRAFQEGPTEFRFALRPHGKLELADASRFAIGLTQPLLVAGARGDKPLAASRLTIDSPDVIVVGLKPGDDGKSIIVRLWGGAGKDAQVTLKWADPVPKAVWLSDLSERPVTEITGPVAVPAWGVVTIRAGLP
jgi:hypothetical protein